MEVESFGSGTLLKHLYAEEEVIPVGCAVAVLGTAGTVIDEATVARLKSGKEAVTDTDFKNAATAKTVSADSTGRISPVESQRHIVASPNAHRLAAELGIDISKVTGTGRDGRIEGGDVKKYAESLSATTAAVSQPESSKKVSMSKMRRAIAVNLQKSVLERPHFNVVMDVDMAKALEAREQLNKDVPQEQRISVNDVLIKACVYALRQHPANQLPIRRGKHLLFIRNKYWYCYLRSGMV